MLLYKYKFVVISRFGSVSEVVYSKVKYPSWLSNVIFGGVSNPENKYHFGLVWFGLFGFMVYQPL